MTALEFAGQALPLTRVDVSNAAKQLGCDEPAIWAVCDVESTGAGFLPDSRPKILFEAQVFGRLTGYRWNASHPNISTNIWDRHLYGAPGAHQYVRLAEAIALDRRAALNAASWGMFQQLGLYDGQAGFNNVESFVKSMMVGEGQQLRTFCAFCKNGGIDKYLRLHDWVRFALRYNGIGERANGYDMKLASAYARRVHERISTRLGHADDPITIGA